MKLISALLGRIKRHNIPIFAAAIAFFGFFALVPALTGVISGYGLIANEQDVIDLVNDGLSSQPDSTKSFVEAQMTDIVNQQGAGIALAISIALAFFSASGAVANLMKALNVVYDVAEDRKFLRLRGTAVALLVGSLLVMGAAMFVMSALPAVLDEINLSAAGEWALRIARFPVLAFIMMAALSVLYQIGPNHNSEHGTNTAHQPMSLVPSSPHRMRLVTLGGFVATVLFVLFTYLFGLYATSPLAGGAAGILGTITAIMVWFQLIALAVLIGAEINAIGESGELATAPMTQANSRQ